MRPRLLLTINNCKFAVDFFARGLCTRTAVARLPLRQLGFLVHSRIKTFFSLNLSLHRPLVSSGLISWITGLFIGFCTLSGFRLGVLETWVLVSRLNFESLGLGLGVEA